MKARKHTHRLWRRLLAQLEWPHGFVHIGVSEAFLHLRVRHLAGVGVPGAVYAVLVVVAAWKTTGKHVQIIAQYCFNNAYFKKDTF